MAAGDERVVFRADAGPGIGGGHVVRSLALAGALAARGWRCAFAVRAPTPETVPALARSGHEVLALEGHPGAEPAAIAGAFPEGAAWLVVDHYRRSAAFERAMRPWARRVLAVDDVPDRPHACEVLLDQTLGREEGEYAGQVPSGCRLLLGPEYALLRPQFPAARPAALARRGRDAVERVLVSFGMVDGRGLTEPALGGLRRAGFRGAADVVLGACAPRLHAVRAAAADLPFPVSVHEQVDDMAALMTQVDVAIGAAGSTSWERCALGLPSLVAVAAENQARIARALAQAGAARVIAERPPLEPEQVAAALETLGGSGEALAAMSRAAARVCDGRGAARVANVLGACA